MYNASKHWRVLQIWYNLLYIIICIFISIKHNREMCVHICDTRAYICKYAERERDTERDMNRIWFTQFDSHCFNQIKDALCTGLWGWAQGGCVMRAWHISTVPGSFVWLENSDSTASKRELDKEACQEELSILQEHVEGISTHKNTKRWGTSGESTEGQSSLWSGLWNWQIWTLFPVLTDESWQHMN